MWHQARGGLPLQQSPPPYVPLELRGRGH